MRSLPSHSCLILAILSLLATPISGEVVISEFLAANENDLTDEDGDSSDWIEILNDTASAVDLLGWRLTDNDEKPAKWVFPSRILQPGELLVVFASDKNRKPATGSLHTNFKLKASGEYLALSDASGAISHAYTPAYPAQVTDVSYGLPSDGHVRFAPQGTACEVGVPVSQADFDANFTDWTTSHTPFTGSSWQTGAHTGVGYSPSWAPYGSLVGPGGDIGTRLANQQRSVCLRVPFTVDDPAAVDELLLRMKWDDGFVALINGTQVATALAPAAPAWNSTATGSRTDFLNNDWTDFSIPATGVTLTTGTNILAVHGFNDFATSPDFLLLPVLEGTLTTNAGSVPPTWFTIPSPGALNTGDNSVGPTLEDAVSSIPRPTGSGASPTRQLTVQVNPTVFPLASVTLYHRTMFGPETAVPMRDDGVSPDATADDHLFSAELPTTAPQAGQMLRWRFEALDSHGNAGRAPAYPAPADSDRYFGTVALDPDTDSSQLPVFHSFLESPSLTDTDGGTRGAFFYLDEFYDNIQIDVHGGATRLFLKKGHDVDFNREHRFLWKEDEARVRDINLLTNYADRTKVRNLLSYEVAGLAGNFAHFAFPVRIEQNGSFHGIWDMVEDTDEISLERNGLDPRGALYKMYNPLTRAFVAVEKKTRKEEGNSDLSNLVNSLKSNQSLSTRRRFAYDHINIPATINYLVTRQLNSGADHGSKNYYLYRDTEITGEWRPLIWDVDLTQGHNYGSGFGYLDDTLHSDNPLDAASRQNSLYNLVYQSPELRAMFLRRMRTLMDSILQAPGTTDGMIETRMREIAATIDPDPANPSPATDGDRDFAAWGTWGLHTRCREEVERVISDYLQPRRSFLFNQAPASRPTLEGDPIPDAPQVNTPGMVDILAIDFLPSSQSQQDEYIQLRNTTGVAVDVSGWSLSGAIDHVFEGGTVINTGPGTGAVDYKGLLHVVKNAAAFRTRATGPTGDEYRLIQGNYRGQLSARGETIELHDAEGLLIDSLTYAGTPTVLQTSLRISELSYNPAPPTAGELAVLPGLSGADFEFFEFINIGPASIDLDGAGFTNGIVFDFPATTLAPNARLLLARNPAALALRYGPLAVPVLGPYSGSLDGGGERIELVDEVGEVILDFTFRDGWYPATDGDGRTLVARDPAGTPTDGFGEAEVWGISLDANGSPGLPDPELAQAYLGWDNHHFTSDQRDDLLISGPDADPDGDGWSNLLEYALHGDPWVPDGSLLSFDWATDGGTTHAALEFTRPTHTIDLTYELLAQAALTPTPLPAVGSVIHSATPGAPGLEDLVLRETAPAASERRFLQIRVSLLP